MKINLRLLLIIFVIVALVSGSSIIIFYSLTKQLSQSQQSKTVLDSSNDFRFTFQSAIEKVDDDLGSITDSINNINNLDLKNREVDFVFTLVDDSLINSKQFVSKENVFLSKTSLSIKQFVKDNPNIVLEFLTLKSGQTIYYGKIISEKFLNKISEKIRADIALVINGIPVEVSNSNKNQGYLLSIIQSEKELKYKNSFELYSDELESADFTATLFTPRDILTPGGKLNFIIFTASKEAAEFRATLKNVIYIIAFAGILLSLVFVLLFTTKLRKQITLLSNAAEITGQGNLEHKVEIVTKDEIGKLGEAFNRMVDQLRRNKASEKDYSEFITLLNQNPTLNEVSDASLRKIIKSTGLSMGVLYLVENKDLRLISSYGISKKVVHPAQDVDYYNNAIEKKEKLEFIFSDNYPEIRTGLVNIKIKYLLIVPIIYNKEVIAILELACDKHPDFDVQSYIDKIQDQLAIGLINAKSFEQLENIVGELRVLNEEYQKQNKFITEQNITLKELHEELKEKADELERQKEKAEELTKLKSQFLASMSHELRTPLISILGLSELVLKDTITNPHTRERMNIVLRNGKKLLNLINNILEFSKLESGKIELKEETFSLNDFLDELRTNIEPIAVEKNISFVIECLNDCNIMVRTDKNKLEQILLNLLFNAIKFTEEGSVKLIMKHMEESSLELIVEDTGIGISKYDQELIFQEFRQVDESTSKQYGGTGLGLAICKKYLDLLGSRLNLESEVGQGSKFSFVLKQTITTDRVSSVKTSSSQKKKLQKKKLNRVLLVNKNKDTVKLMSDYLQQYNYEVEAASNSDEAIKKTKLLHPVAIIIDNSLPERKSWKLLIELKKLKQIQMFPVIMSSILENEKVGYGLSLFDFIIEPITEEYFNFQIQRVENFSKDKIEKIVLIGEDTKRLSSVINKITGKKEISVVEINDNLHQDLSNSKPDLILIDSMIKSENPIELIDELKHNRETRNIPLLMILSPNLTDIELQRFSDALEDVNIKQKHHPLDVLKILRDRLKIHEHIKSEKILLEDSDDKANLNDDFENVNKSETGAGKILIVDDNSDTLFTIGELLNDIGYETMFAKNGIECLLALNNYVPDLILLDIMMPQMDGFETIKRIRKDDRFYQIPVIALTAYAMLEDKEIIEKNGFDDLVTKPIDIPVLEQKVKNYVDKKIDEMS